MAVFKKDISDRGTKRTPEEIRKIAEDLHWDKIERSHDFSVESMATGLRGGFNATPNSRGSKNAVKMQKLDNISRGISTRTSGLQGRSGQLGGQHMGGHSDVGQSMPTSIMQGEGGEGGLIPRMK